MKIGLREIKSYNKNMLLVTKVVLIIIIGGVLL